MFDLEGCTERIVNLCMQVDGIVKADTKYPGNTHEQLPDTDMPFVFVEVGVGANVPFTSDILVTTRDWLLLLYVEKFKLLDKPDEDAAWAAVSPYIVAMTQYFTAHKRLRLNDSGFPGVDSSTITNDDGPQSESRRREYAYGAAFRLSITYSEYTRV